MSHGMDDKDWMAYTKRTPWHGIGTDLIEYAKENGSDYVDSATIIKAAKLDWTVSVREQFVPARAVPIAQLLDADGKLDADDLVLDPDSRRVVRDDTNDLLASVGKKYTVIQNSECASFLDALFEGSEDMLRFESAGSIFGGRRIYFSAVLKDDFIVKRKDGSEDVSIEYVIVSSNHDGYGSFKVLGSQFRVECANTLSAALAHASNVFSIKHTPNVASRLQEAKTAIQMQRKYYGELKDCFELLDEIEVSAEDVRNLSATVLTKQGSWKTVDEVMVSLEKRFRNTSKLDERQQEVSDDADKVATLFRDGAGNQGRSAYDMLNGFTDFTDHDLAVRKARTTRSNDVAVVREKMFGSLMYGEIATMKSRALGYAVSLIDDDVRAKRAKRLA